MAPPNTIWYCEKCKEENRSIKDTYNPINGKGICHIHNTPLEAININIDEYLMITKVSTDISFLEAMIDLKQKDPIEFQLKMSQFKSQNHTKAVEEDRSIPKCPTCGSVNIKPITASERVTSIVGLGIFSKKINKTYKCLNCKCTW